MATGRILSFALKDNQAPLPVAEGPMEDCKEALLSARYFDTDTGVSVLMAVPETVTIMVGEDSLAGNGDPTAP